MGVIPLSIGDGKSGVTFGRGLTYYSNSDIFFGAEAAVLMPWLRHRFRPKVSSGSDSGSGFASLVVFIHLLHTTVCRLLVLVAVLRAVGQDRHILNATRYKSKNIISPDPLSAGYS